MKLQLNKIVEVLSKMKDDEFYFKNYAPEIIESYADEIAEEFMCWCEENKVWINDQSNRQKIALFKRERSNLT